MFGRKSADADASVSSLETSITPKGDGAKGRPTPTRKEAEAARLAKVRTPRDRKSAAAAERARRFENTAKMREAMKTGDDRYLPVRDKGQVRRFVRDYVDSKLTIAELVLPLLVVTLALGMTGNRQMSIFANAFMTFMLIATAGNLAIIGIGLTRQVKTRWPDQNRKGLIYYACVRTLQLRPLRMPKTQVKIGTKLPESYK